MGIALAVLRRPDAPAVQHYNVVKFQAPKNVSPLIRASRWTALTLGVAWGWYRYHQLSQQHVEVRAYEHAQELEAQAMEEKMRKYLLIESTRDVLGALGLEQSEANMSNFGVGAEQH